MSYSFQCSVQEGFAPNPLHPQPIGYLIDFEGLGLSAPLAKDLTVPFPYNSPVPTYKPIVPVNNKVSVTAIIENFSWNGGVGDSLIFSCYMSRNNANQLWAFQQKPLTTKITAFGWWIANYDQETKEWYEVAYPLNPEKPSGLLGTSGGNIQLQIDSTPTQVVPGVIVQKVSFEIAPAANQQAAISLAASPTARVVKEWGLVVS